MTSIRKIVAIGADDGRRRSRQSDPRRSFDGAGSPADDAVQGKMPMGGHAGMHIASTAPTSLREIQRMIDRNVADVNTANRDQK